MVCRPPKCGFCLAPLTQLVCPHSRNGAGGGVTSDLTAAWPTGSPGKGGGAEGRERPVRGPDCNPAVLPWGTAWTCSSLSIHPQSLIPIGTAGPLQTIPAGPTHVLESGIWKFPGQPFQDEDTDPLAPRNPHFARGEQAQGCAVTCPRAQKCPILALSGCLEGPPWPTPWFCRVLDFSI